MKRKKVLITGADGVLGSNLVREFIKRNYEVSVFLLKNSSDPITLKGLKLNYFYGNILNKSELFDAVKGHEFLVHAAASTIVYPARSEMVNQVNIEGTRNVIEAALKYQVKKLVHIGTANSFSFGSKENPGNEKSPFTGYKYGMDYIDSKKQAQDLVLDAVKDRSLNAVVLNPTFMIGPYDSKPSSGSMIIALKKGKIPGFTSGAKNYIAVKDAAVAIANSIYLGKKGECYILGNHNLSFKEAFEIMANTIGAQPPKIKLSKTMVMLYGLINSFMARLLKYKPSVTKELAKISCEEQYYCSCKARKELRMPVTPIDIAIKECYEWFTENGYVQ